jgi:hypothetical protein
MQIKHFDTDYVLLLENVKEDFESWKSLEKLPEEIRGEYLKAYLDALLTLVSITSGRIIREIDSIVRNFFTEAINALKENMSSNTFKEQVEKFIADLHRKVYGWPKGG